MTMKLSARNQLQGTVTNVHADDVMAEVTVTLPGGQTLVSVITAESARRLGLKQGSAVVVVIKATEAMIATND
jgi:molybdate transport system regulatory protein